MAFLDATFFGNTVLKYIIFFGIIIGAIVVGRIIYYLTQGIGRKLTKKTKGSLDDIILDLIEEPLVFLIFVGGMFIAKSTIYMSDRFTVFYDNTLKILVILAIAYFIIKLIDSLMVHYLQPITSKTKSDLDDQLIPIIRKLVKWTLIIITGIMVISEFGYDVTSIIAGVGIGGLAFALAAQDMLKNFFGGLTLLSDKPFKVNQRVKIGSYDGFVREIGIRSTRIETFEGTKLTLPNSYVADNVIENVSAERARRVKMMIGLTYNTTADQLEKAKKILSEIILKNDKTDDESKVIFDSFGDFSVNIMLIYWIKDLKQILETKDEVNLAIKRRFDQEGLDFAFPTQTIYVAK